MSSMSSEGYDFDAVSCSRCDGYDTDCPECGLCSHCDGNGWGIVGTDWDCEDGINGPYDGETEKCPWCHGSGKLKDVTSW
jgi:hypothetical protein